MHMFGGFWIDVVIGFVAGLIVAGRRRHGQMTQRSMATIITVPTSRPAQNASAEI